MRTRLERRRHEVGPVVCREHQYFGLRRTRQEFTSRGHTIHSRKLDIEQHDGGSDAIDGRESGASVADLRDHFKPALVENLAQRVAEELMIIHHATFRAVWAVCTTVKCAQSPRRQLRALSLPAPIA